MTNLAVLTISRYPAKHKITAFHSMALFRPSLALNKALNFYKLMGTGRNGTFDKNPDWQQYAIFSVSGADEIPPFPQANYIAWREKYYGRFIHRYWKWANANTTTYILEPILSHGTWNKKNIFPAPLSVGTAGEKIAVLTRASIRLSRAREFWANVPPVQQQMTEADGLLYSVGIGEVPLLRQSTFSIWKDEASMKAFAYRMQEHREVIQKTRSRNWYSEEMFTRFRVLHTFSSE